MSVYEKTSAWYSDQWSSVKQEKADGNTSKAVEQGIGLVLLAAPVLVIMIASSPFEYGSVVDALEEK